jgi:rhomboid protease GluP
MDRVEFVASPRSDSARMRRTIWIAAGLLLAFEVVRTGLTERNFVLVGLVCGLLLVLDVAFRRKGRGARVVLLDAQGLEAPRMSGATTRLAWNEIVGASVQGRMLQLQLRTGREGPEFAVDALSLPQQEELLDLVLQRAGVRVGGAAGVNELRAERVFKERLEALAPITWLTFAIVAANVLVWSWMAAQGANGLRADAAVLLDWGANSAYEVVERGEWWRLLTAAFLHGGVVHLAMNMIGLLSAGVTVERLYGRVQYALIYLVAALVGSALSLHFSAERVVSVGASGAVFGVAGALLVGLFSHRKELPRGMLRQTLGGLAFFILYSLLQGFARQGIDNAAHVGGLLAGGALAWWLPTRLDAHRFSARMRKRAVAGTLLAGAVVAGLGLSAEPGVDQRQLSASVQSLQHGLRVLDLAYKALEADHALARKGTLGELELDERSRRVHAPAFRGAVEQLQQVSLPPGDPRSAFAADALRAAQLLTEMLAMESDIVDGRPVPARPERYAAAEKELSRLSSRMQEQAERLKEQARR